MPICYDVDMKADDAIDGMIETGTWGAALSWEFYRSFTPPPIELCTAVMCVAIVHGKIVLTRSKRGWGVLGGHIEQDESLEQALRREALEEGGFVIDTYVQFAVRKIIASAPVTARQEYSYPYPISYIAYYWATTSQPLLRPTGDEVVESARFSIDEIAAMDTGDHTVIREGWQAYFASS